MYVSFGGFSGQGVRETDVGAGRRGLWPAGVGVRGGGATVGGVGVIRTRVADVRSGVGWSEVVVVWCGAFGSDIPGAWWSGGGCGGVVELVV